MFVRAFVLGLLTLIPRDGDSDPPADPPPTDPNTPPGDKVFKQKDVDYIVSQRQKALRTQYEALEKNYTTLLEQSNLSENQRQELQGHLEQVQTQLRTKEQQAAIDQRKAAERHQAELKAAIEERDRYQGLFTKSTVERAVIDAAAKHEAYNPSQFVSLVGDRVRVVDELDEQGNRTGRMIPVVEVQVKDEATGQMVTVRKSPEDVIVDMKGDVQSWGNLFRSNVARGVGEGRGAGTPGRVDATKVSDEEYFANRAAYQAHYGIRGRKKL